MANRHYHFKFNVEKDATYIQRLDAQENMQAYIRRLILSDIAADGLKDIIRLAPDPEEDYHTAREDYYAAECQAVNHDAPADCCSKCPHYDFTYDTCFIEENFKRDWREKHGE